MFAFAVVEHATGRLVLGRRPARHQAALPGPDPDRLRFASTLPALLAGGGTDTSIDLTALALLHDVPQRGAARRGRSSTAIRKLPPATVRVVEPDGRHRDHVYWQPEFSRDPDRADWTAQDWQDALLDQLRVAVDRRMVADVPVGVLLSGGIDSSLVVALLAEAGQTGLATFSIGFDSAGGESGDEFEYQLAGGRAVRHRPPPDPDRQPPAAAGHRCGHRGDERAHGEPRLRGLLPAQPGRLGECQGGAVRPGCGRGAGRLRLVPAARRGTAGRGGRGVRRGVLRPALAGDEPAAGAELAGRPRRPEPRSSPTGSAGPARRPRWTRRCATTPW